MLYGRKCPLTETIPAFIPRILCLITLFGVFAGSQLYSQPPTAVQTLRLDSPLKLCRTLTGENIDGGKIASDNVNVYYAITNTGKVYSADLASGTVEWEIDLGGQIQTTPYMLRDGLFIITRTDKNYIVRRLTKKTGLTVWQTRFIQGSTSSTVEFYLSSLNENLIVAASDGSFRAFDLGTGQLTKSEFTQKEMTTEPFFDGDQIIFGTVGRRIVRFSIGSFKTTAELTNPSVTSDISAVLQSRSGLIQGDASGVVRFSGVQQSSTGVKTKARWRFRAGGKISHLTLAGKENGDKILISSLDNYIYLVALDTGKLIWKKRTSGRVIFAPRIAGSYLILTDVDSSTASIVEISSGRTVNRISLPMENLFTGAATIARQSVILAGTGGLFTFTSPTDCKN